MPEITKRGLAIAVMYVLMSVTLGETTKRINSSKSWDKPILTAWFNHVFLAVLWFVLVVQAWIDNDGGVFSRVRMIVGRITVEWQTQDTKNGVWRRFIAFMVFLAALLLLATGGWIEGLQHATVTDMQALQQLIPVFTIILAFFLLGERASLVKLFAVTVSLAGVAVFALSVASDHTKTMDIWGIILGVSSAVGYAFYCVLVKRVFGAGLDLDASVLVLFFIGVGTFFPMMVVIPIINSARLEEFGIPDNWQIFGVLCLNALIAVLCNIAHLGAIALNGPTFTNIIAISQIAVAAIIDYFLDGDVLTLGEWMGCLCIIIGVLLTMLESYLCISANKTEGYEKAPKGEHAVNNISYKPVGDISSLCQDDV